MNPSPKVSIVLPNLNTPLPFLKERLETILYQTFEDWECIVIDGFSDNGSWERITKLIGNDARFSLHQLPRKGVYNAWNEGIKISRGEYVYIATSDDTMGPTLLQNMINALDQYEDCDLAHCCLTIIDEKGDKMVSRNWERYAFVKYTGTLVQESHKRIAPYDALLYPALGTIYTSVTQLLVRRRVFNESGLFSTDFGPIGDYEWGMRIAFRYNVIHVPKYLATWRIHRNQLTDNSKYSSLQFSETVSRMIDAAVTSASIDSSIINRRWLQRMHRLRMLRNMMQAQGSALDRVKAAIMQLIRNPLDFFYLTKYLVLDRRTSPYLLYRRELENHGFDLSKYYLKVASN